MEFYTFRYEFMRNISVELYILTLHFYFHNLPFTFVFFIQFQFFSISVAKALLTLQNVMFSFRVEQLEYFRVFNLFLFRPREKYISTKV